MLHCGHVTSTARSIPKRLVSSSILPANNEAINDQAERASKDQSVSKTQLCSHKTASKEAKVHDSGRACVGVAGLL